MWPAGSENAPEMEEISGTNCRWSSYRELTTLQSYRLRSVVLVTNRRSANDQYFRSKCRIEGPDSACPMRHRLHLISSCHEGNKLR